MKTAYRIVCANNPVNYIDPSGHKSLWKKIKNVVITIVAVVAAVVTCAVLAPALYSLIAFGNLTTAASLASFSAHVGVTAISGAMAGAAAGALSAAIMGGNIGQGALTGAVGGAIGGVVGSATQGWGSASQGMAQIGSAGVAGGVTSEMTGGTFWDGFRTGAIAAAGSVASRYVYNKWVRYGATTASGGDAVEKRWDTYPVEGANNVGFQAAPDSIWAEGKPISQFFNRIPGINATAGMHDVFQVNIDKYMGNVARNVLTVPGMLPAAAISYSALTVDRGLTAIYQGGKRR